MQTDFNIIKVYNGKNDRIERDILERSNELKGFKSLLKI